jgi:hypothetical protein
VGVAADPDEGPANTVFAGSVANAAVKVPVEVTGDPLTVKILGIDRATDVTPVLETIVDDPPVLTEIPVPPRV